MKELKVYCDMCKKSAGREFFSLNPKWKKIEESTFGHAQYKEIEICVPCAKKTFPSLLKGPIKTTFGSNLFTQLCEE